MWVCSIRSLVIVTWYFLQENEDDVLSKIDCLLLYNWVVLPARQSQSESNCIARLKCEEQSLSTHECKNV